MALFIFKVFAILAIVLANAVQGFLQSEHVSAGERFRPPGYAFIEKQTMIGGSGPNSEPRFAVIRHDHT